MRAWFAARFLPISSPPSDLVLLMASKHACLCGFTIRTNLYQGHSLSLLVPEELTDLPDHLSESAHAIRDRLVLQSQVVAQCPNCGTLSVVDNSGDVRFFVPAKAGQSGH